MYRSPLAQAAHIAVLSYIRDNLDENAFIKAIDSLDKESLLEQSIHGHSHLIDILHLPFEITKNSLEKKCLFMMNALLDKAKRLGVDTVVILLTQTDHLGFTPLHFALKSGNPANMRTYFDEVRQAVDNRWMSQNQYLDLLLRPTTAGFTPLHSALKSGNPANMRTYFDEVRQAVGNQWMSQNQYLDLLLRPNTAGFTPLHSALISGTPANMHTYFDEVRQAVDNRWMSQNQYLDLLLRPNTAGFTPLHSALISGNPANMHTYFDEVRWAVSNRWMSQNQYLDLLLRPNKSGFTPLHQAANSNSIEVLNLFLNELKQKLSLEDYKKALFCEARRIMPSCERSKSNAAEINQLLAEERKKIGSMSTVFAEHGRKRQREDSNASSKIAFFSPNNSPMHHETRAAKRQRIR